MNEQDDVWSWAKQLDSDSVDLVVKHTGRRPGPAIVGTQGMSNPSKEASTISAGAMQALVDQFAQFVGARIQTRLERGESVEQVDVHIDLTLREEVKDE